MFWNAHIQSSSMAVWQADLAAAEEALKAALQFAKHNFSRQDTRLAMTLSLLGHLFFCRGMLERSEQLLEQSLRLHADNNCSNPYVVMDLFCLVEIKRSLRKFDQARAVYAELRRRLIAGAVPVVNSQDVGELLERLDATISSAEQDSLADATASRSLPLPTYQESAGGSFDEVWQRQFQTGLASMKTDEAETDELITAYLNLESAYRLASSMFSSGDTRLVATVTALADACTKLRMFDQAESLYRQAIAAVRANNDSVDAGNSIKLALVFLYMEAGQLQKAHSMLSEENLASMPLDVEPLRKRLNQSQQLLEAYNRSQDLIAQAKENQALGDLEKAARLANNALSQLKQGFPPQHIENARVLRYRSELLMQLGNDEQALDLAKRAERIEKAYQAQKEEWARLVQELPRVECGAPVS